MKKFQPLKGLLHILAARVQMTSSLFHCSNDVVISHRWAIYFECGKHRVAVEPPDVIGWLVGVQPCMLFLLQLYLTDDTASAIFS